MISFCEDLLHSEGDKPLAVSVASEGSVPLLPVTHVTSIVAAFCETDRQVLLEDLCAPSRLYIRANAGRNCKYFRL